MKKITVELWVFFLIAFLSIIFAIGNGILVRQELVGHKKLGIISKASLFLAELPANFNRIISNELKVEDRFKNLAGFDGEPLEFESYLLLSRYDGDLKKSIVELVDMTSFEVLKVWEPDITSINALVDKSIPEFEYLDRDYNALRYRINHPFLTDDGGLIFQNSSPLVKIDKDSKLVWQKTDDVYHHSIEEDHEGNLWIPTRFYPYKLDKKFVGTEYGPFRDDAITKISAEGEILFQKSVSNIFIDNDLDYLLFVLDSLNFDPIHLNDIEPVLSDGPFWQKGDVFLSIRNQSMVILYRPSTNEVLWTGTGQTYAQHDVDIIDDHRISIFNNNSKWFFDGEKVDENNEVIIYDFETDSYSKYLNEQIIQNEVKTMTSGRSEILNNGVLFIEETNYGRLLFLSSPEKGIQYVNRASDGNVYLVTWSRMLYKQKDIDKVRKIISKGK